MNEPSMSDTIFEIRITCENHDSHILLMRDTLTSENFDELKAKILKNVDDAITRKTMLTDRECGYYRVILNGNKHIAHWGRALNKPNANKIWQITGNNNPLTDGDFENIGERIEL